jgi:hypothetical protein
MSKKGPLEELMNLVDLIPLHMRCVLRNFLRNLASLADSSKFFLNKSFDGSL